MNESNPKDLSDRSLAMAIAERSPTAVDAFEILYHRHQSAVRLFISSRVSQVHVDDLNQTVWIKAWSKIPSGFRSENVLAWILKTARNEIIDFYRRRNDVETLPDNLPSHDVAAIEAALHSERQQALASCMKQLSSRDLAIIRLAFLGDAVDKIASALNISANATYKSLSRIKARLKRCVEVATK